MYNNYAEREEKARKILDYFKENEEVFNECLEELDGYNGYLGDDRYYYMDDMGEFFHGEDPISLLNRAYFGYDGETWTTDEHGEKHYGAFNPNRDYFTFNGYGNFVSADYKDYSAHLDAYAVEEMAENRQHIYTIDDNDELSALFDEYEQDETAE